jgi:hypothetical protein
VKRSLNDGVLLSMDAADTMAPFEVTSHIIAVRGPDRCPVVTHRQDSAVTYEDRADMSFWAR